MNPFLRWILVIILALPALAVPSFAVGTETEGRVFITVVDGIGGEAKGGRLVSFVAKGTGTSFADRFHSIESDAFEGDAIPYGEYDLKMQAAGFPDVSRPVTVSKPEVYIEVSMRTATVHVMPVLNNGWTEEGFVETIAEFRFSDDDSDLADRFKGGTATEVPYGEYSLKVFSTGTFSAYRKVYVFKPEVWVVAGLNFEPQSPESMAPRNVLTGAVEHIPPNEEPVYVRMVGIYLDYRIDDRVQVFGDIGTFTLTGINPYGSFLLITTGRTGVLDIRQIEIPEAAKRPITIDLQPEHQKP